jgi:hypothetical protein
VSQSQESGSGNRSSSAVLVPRESPLLDPVELGLIVDEVVQSTPVVDIHTHLFAPEFGSLNLWGIDELLTYHYLIAEFFRSSQIEPQEFFKLERAAQASRIWDALFVRNTPLSEATRGVVTVLSQFGIDTASDDLTDARKFFASQSPREHFDRCLELANVSDVVMTNDPMDERELAAWDKLDSLDQRFHAALRMDGLLNEWQNKHAWLAAQGFDVSGTLEGASILEIRRFLDRAITRFNPFYLAVSLPNTFEYPDESARTRLIRDVIIPVCRERGVPFALMIGVRRAVNPALQLAGDGLGKASIAAVDRLCVENPENKFLVSMLSRENQHELCVSARKFSNLMPFGCWWFLNNPSIVEEITRERVELLGPSFIPQHSDARVFEQLVYKWRHSRKVISKVLAETYVQLLRDGRSVTRAEVERDVTRMFSGNFRDWTPMEQI